jgi:adenylate cyclase
MEEYDYYLRGHQLFSQFNAEGNTRARQVWQEGLTRFPDSALLQSKLAWTYVRDIWTFQSDQPERELQLAWELGKQVEAAQNKPRLATWLNHWLMAWLHQWHEGDFARSVAEAEAALRMVPYDAFSRADLAGVMANAGMTDQAIEWAEEAIRRDPEGPEWLYVGSLAWAYYLAGQYDESLTELEKMSEPSSLVLAAVYVRLGRIDEARAVMVEFAKDNPGWALEDEVFFRLKEPLEQAYLDDLRKAGLPES